MRDDADRVNQYFLNAVVKMLQLSTMDYINTCTYKHVNINTDTYIHKTHFPSGVISRGDSGGAEPPCYNC